MKYLKIIIGLLIMSLVLSGCTLLDSPTTNNKVTTRINNNEISFESIKSIDELKGKPVVIFWGMTTCPHCRDAIGPFSEKVYDVYKNDAYIWGNILDKKKFPATVPQGYNPNLKYSAITGDTCKYVPSWILVDEQGNIIDKSCGTKEISLIAPELKSLLEREQKDIPIRE